MFNGKKLFEYITSFSKIITIVWIAIWVETILFTQVATVFQLGDVTALQYINDNVIQIGVIVCGFYFCTKTIENVAQGIECFFTEENEKKRLFNINDTVDVTPIIEDEEYITDADVIEPTPISNYGLIAEDIAGEATQAMIEKELEKLKKPEGVIDLIFYVDDKPMAASVTNVGGQSYIRMVDLLKCNLAKEVTWNIQTNCVEVKTK